MKYLILLLVLLACLPFASFARDDSETGITVQIPLSYLSFSTTDASSTVNATTIIGAAPIVGYRFSMGLVIGGTYDYWDNDVKMTTATGATSETDSTATGYGATVGLMSGGFGIFGSYLFSDNYQTGTKAPTDTRFTYTGGTGMRFDASYCFMVFSHFSLGPAVSYYTFTYTKEQDVKGNPIVLASNYQRSGINPYIKLDFTF